MAKKSGTSANDRLIGGDGDDELLGRQGDDVLEGGAGNDRLYGGEGDDHLIGGAGHDQVWGNQGNDVLEGGDGNDRLDGQEGHDRLFGGGGDDELYGKDGDDFLSGGDGHDFLSGGKGDDHLIGGAGNDRLDAGAGNDLLEGGDGDDELLGRQGDDVLEGGAGNDRLYGGEGDDHLIGGAGHDQVWGNQGNDVLEGGDGNDRLDGQEGHDRLFGGGGDDELYGKDGDDFLSGGDGHDFLSGGKGDDHLIGGAGNDRLDAGAGNDLLEGGDGDDVLLGRQGDDLFIYRTGDGDDEVNGEDGADTIRLNVDDGWILSLSKGKILSDADGQMQLSGSAAGTITLADGSTIRFKNVERIEAVASEPDDGDQPPAGLTLLAEPVVENAPDGSVVGTAMTTGPDAAAALAKAGSAGGGLTYALSDDAGGRFAIDPDTGVITVADGTLLDHESAAQHSIEVTVTDAGGRSVTQTFAIEVADVNEAPGGLALSANEIAEYAAEGTVVGTASASDPDAGDVLSYALADDAGGRFAIDPDTGVITIADGSLLDYESASQHSIEVTVTDAGGLSTSETFTIQVADVNEAPDGLALSANEIAESATGGTVVGTVSASDPDAGDVLSYALTDDAGGRFAIDPDTGVITVADGTLLDHESGAQHSIEVTVTDAGGLSTSETFTIKVADVNEAPGGLALSASEIAEDAAEGTVVGTVSAADADTGDTLSYALADDAGGRFAIDPDTGVITIADGSLLDYESASQHSIEVTVTDAGGLSASQTFTIEVGKANQGPGGLDLGGGAVAEGALGGTVVGTVSATDPDGDTLTYSLSDDAGGRFAIDPDTGVITVADGAALDHENASQHSIEVTVTDAGGLSASQTFTITVADVNEAPGGLALSASEVVETAADGTVVGTVSAADPDTGDTLSYALTDDAGGRFTIDPQTGVITVADGALFDRADAPQHSIEVKVTDADGLSASETFVIEVANVNEAPSIVGLDASDVAEGASEGTVVGTVSASDPDAGDGLTYSLTDDAGGRFAIDPDTGAITVADAALLDYESASQHSIEVTVTDAGGLSAGQTFVIDVVNVNEAPGGLALSASEIAEDAAEGTVVGTASASDPDAGDGLTYSLTDDAGGRFAIDPDSGVITVNDGSLLDHESASQHSIEVTVTDAGGLSASQTFTITVVDVNEAPGGLALSASEIAENAPGGMVVGTVSATDPDAGDELTYALSDDAGGRFAIDPDSGVITVADGTLLDRESAAQHNIEVTVTDAGGRSVTQTFAIEVANVNEAPGGLALSATEIAEDAADGTVVGTVSTADADTGDTFSYALSDDAGGRFTIHPDTGVITVADGGLLDYESAAQHEVTVQVTDAGGLSASQAFTITLADVNETPHGLALSAAEVAEDSTGGTVIGTVSATDPDAGDALTYALSDDAGGRFAIDAQTGVVTVADGAALDYETAAQHSIEVTVTDAGGLSTSQTFTIEVTNVNEAPNGLSLDAGQVAENAAVGTVVGTASASDPDAGDALSYSLTDDAGGRFAIDAHTGVVTVANGLLFDHENATQHSLTVQVTDAGGLGVSQTFTIQVADVNEAPGGLSLDASEVEENVAVGTVVGTVSAGDPDAGDALSYALIDDAGGRFLIDADTGVITIADGTLLDHESASQHSITVQVTDAGGLSLTPTFAIAVGDINEAPSVLDLDSGEVAENAAAGTVAASVSASDPDAGDTLSYSLTDDAGGRFAIDPLNGVITVADGAAFDHDVASQHSVTVQVTDAGGLSTTRSVVIEVIGVNGAPSIAGLSAREVAENAAAGTVAASVSASDSDAGDTLSYALSDDAGGRFAINPDSGVITVAGGTVLDHENASQHSIEVTVTDTGGLSTTRAFTIDVANVNEAPGIAGLDTGEVAENAAQGTVVGTVAASDPDAGDALTYSLSDDADGRFAIDPNTGVITVADSVALDHENATQHSIEVMVTDAGGLGASQAFTIEVADINEAPVIQALSSNGVIEGAIDGTAVGTVSAIDPDIGDALSYALTDDAGGRFAIDPDSGMITVADGSLLDYDEADQHSITVEVTDAQGLSDSATYVIDLQKDNSGNDTLNGGAGDDLIDGGAGDDSIFGGGGDDHLIGGDGDDWLNGDDGNDLLEGGAGNDFLFGDRGDDSIFGGDGHDQLFGGMGHDVVNGDAGNDELSGSLGNDVLNGGAGTDTIFGGSGNDVLAGGAGDDILSGDAGFDRFVFTSPDEGVDQILDFGTGDVLAIGDMLVDFAEGGEAEFVRLVGDGTDTTVQVDVDGAANSEAWQSIAMLNGVSGVSLDDLVSAGQIDFWMS